MPADYDFLKTPRSTGLSCEEYRDYLRPESEISDDLLRQACAAALQGDDKDARWFAFVELIRITFAPSRPKVVGETPKQYTKYRTQRQPK